jgi:hypothetical protein
MQKEEEDRKREEAATEARLERERLSIQQAFEREEAANKAKQAAEEQRANGALVESKKQQKQREAEAKKVCVCVCGGGGGGSLPYHPGCVPV